MEAIAAPSSPVVAEEPIPDWKLWKNRWLDGYRNEYDEHDRYMAAGYSNDPARRPRLNLFNQKNGMRNAIVSCCGSHLFNVTIPEENRFHGLRTWKNYLKEMYPYKDRWDYWYKGLGIYAVQGADAETAKKLFDMPEDTVTVELPDLGGTHIIMYRDVYDVEHV